MIQRTYTKDAIKRPEKRYKTAWEEICAIMPAYLDNGTNGTIITSLDGSTEQISRRLDWVVDDLLLHLHTSKAVLVKNSRAYLGKQARRVPLVAAQNFCLVPVKGRVAISGYEGLLGYVVMGHVADAIRSGKQSMVYFNGGGSIAVYDNINVLWSNLNLAKEIKQTMEG